MTCSHNTVGGKTLWLRLSCHGAKKRLVHGSLFRVLAAHGGRTHTHTHMLTYMHRGTHCRTQTPGSPPCGAEELSARCVCVYVCAMCVRV